MIAALLQHEPATRRAWLSFPAMPPQPVRTALKATGWLYHGGHRAWHHTAETPHIPAGVAVAHAGECFLSAVKPRNGEQILTVLAQAKAVIARQHSEVAPP